MDRVLALTASELRLVLRNRTVLISTVAIPLGLGLFLALLSFVSALSAAGSKLLVVVDDEADKGKYSTFWSDLQCKSFTAIPPYPMHRTLN